ncbi:HD domain-containing protein [Chondrinema litorale]|uniref:HD domain-containing protein n=1 Tax=Chondrinema litorale TaxID=2994555 RepID=UPI002542A1C4|nr:HD domain-containing protein [Chondrinema litorale]UZR94392.1 HD domain-containing protein [Chondrinema litorale]
MKKKKIINDPVYGFISINSDLIFDVIQHPYFQRLRRVKQLGLTDFVYPGALHTRFHHALGAMHLMGVTLNVLRNKGQEISEEEFEGALLAILLHDIGHGPFSHALERSILRGVHHEDMSILIMNKLNNEFNNSLDIAIAIFTNNYHRKFFHQLVSSQLDMDRLDYLQRDCYFTGVIEGKVGFDRIVRMLDVHDDQIVVEEKGIYSIENFLNARRLMYWQVYLHKTTLSTEQMLIQIIKRAKYLAQKGVDVFSSKPLSFFLNASIGFEDFKEKPEYLEYFARLDDFDIWGSIKVWADHDDKVLSELSRMLLERRLFRVELTNKKSVEKNISSIRESLSKKMGISLEDAKFFCTKGKITNKAYVSQNQNILIKSKKGEIIDVAKASDLPNIEALSKIVKKFYLCYPKVLSL